jgi:hypothetical protein
VSSPQVTRVASRTYKDFRAKIALGTFKAPRELCA